MRCWHAASVSYSIAWSSLDLAQVEKTGDGASKLFAGRSCPSHVTRRASRRGDVAFQGVIHHHAIGIKPPTEAPDGSLHALDPAAGQTILVPPIVQRNYFIPKNPVQILAVPGVVKIQVGMSSAGSDGETIQAVVGFGPPTVEDGQVQAGIQDHLLTAGSGCLQRPP